MNLSRYLFSSPRAKIVEDAGWNLARGVKLFMTAFSYLSPSFYHRDDSD
jgi:hypothetical protein